MTPKLEGQIRAAILAGFGNALVNASALQALSINDLLIVYYNWCGRGIPASPYKVSRSAALRANPLSSDPRYQPALDRIEALLTAGDDISPYLSRGLMTAFQTPSGPPHKLNKRRDLDLLVNDWGIHHLHLSNDVEGDGFVTRTKPLLFLAVKRGHAFLIDILGHGHWTDTSLIETIVREWPEENLIFEMKGVLGLRHYPTESERTSLRNAGMNVPIEVDGKFYMSRAGMSTAGTPIMAVRHVADLVDRIEALDRYIASHPDDIATEVAAAGYQMSDNPDWEFMFVDGGFGMIDRPTGLFLPA